MQTRSAKRRADGATLRSRQCCVPVIAAFPSLWPPLPCDVMRHTLGFLSGFDIGTSVQALRGLSVPSTAPRRSRMTHSHMNQPSQIQPRLFLARPLRSFVVRLHSPGMLKHQRICGGGRGGAISNQSILLERERRLRTRLWRGRLVESL